MNDHESAYAGLVDAADESSHWAFGTSFDDPLAGVDTTLPDGAIGPEIAEYCLMLGDDALVAAQRLTQWSTRAPELEEELALANIGLDMLGQARLLLARAAAADATVVPALPENSPVPAEDALAFFRDESQFRNVWIVELANGDFAFSVAKLLVFSTFRLATLQRLRRSRDPVIAAVAAKGVKEVAYHRDYSARWFVVLACGTPESRCRVQAAVSEIWHYVGELFTPHPLELRLTASGLAVDSSTLRPEFDSVMTEVFNAAGLKLPALPIPAVPHGRNGHHSSALTTLLTEMQSLARQHPEGLW
jgi:ring-1,2-phenylacetyl-CoA epoxidase subunit PaaC